MKVLIILLLLIKSVIVNAEPNNYKAAFHTATEAAYIQTGSKEIVEKKIEDIKKNIPQEYKKLIDLIGPIMDTIVKQRIEVTYDF